MGGFHFNPLKGITRALGIHDSARPGILRGLEFVFPVIALSNELSGHGLEKAFQAFQPKPPAPPRPTSLSTNPYYGPGNSYNVTYGSPNYGGGGGGLDYGYQPQQTYGYQGVSPWGYSTGSPIYSTPQFQESSGRQDRSWEDLTSLAAGVLPFFL